MKVQTKILLLLLVLTAIFFGGLALLRRSAQQTFHRIAVDRRDDRARFYDAFLKRQGEKLETFVQDSTISSPTVHAVAENNLPWIVQNFDIENENIQGRTNAQAVWVYRPDRTLVFSKNLLGADAELHDIPLPDAAFDALEHRRLMHFFLKVSEGYLEVRAATIHESVDGARKDPPQGFFFAAKIWNDYWLNLLGSDTDNHVQFLSAVPPAHETTSDQDADKGIISFTRTFEGWNGLPVARVLVCNDSKPIEDLNDYTRLLLALLVGSALALLVLLTTVLTVWVSRPLRLIMQTLKTERLAPIERLRVTGGEFGNLAELIREFFGQRENLIAEVFERKNAQEALRESGEQLRQAQKMEAVGRLAGGVAHDFNNLLTAILGYAELILARRDVDTSMRGNVEAIQKAGRQAAAVTHQLLAFSRKQVLQPRVIDLNALVSDFERILRRVIGEHIELRTDAGAPCGRVRADPNQIEQVILNLSVNARDAMPRGGRLLIRTDNVRFDDAAAHQLAPDLTGGTYVLLEVTDNGCGMNAEVMSRIFEPFYTTKEQGKGTGLGLATVYGVVKQSGGTTTVESTPGEGTTFRVYLPMEDAEVEGLRPKTVVPVQPPSRRMETVLIVEDEEIVRELVCQVLSEHGYDVLCAANGTEALQMSAEHRGPIALLVTDVVMPQIGGLELSHRLTALRPELKVLYVSGYSEDDMSEQGVISSDMEFLEKPFTPQAITRKVREILAEARPLVAAGVTVVEPQPVGADGRDGRIGRRR